MRKILSFYAILGMLFLVAVALNSYTDAAGKQYTFVTSAGQAGMAEIALANMALSKSQNEDVRQFAQMMIADHSSSGDELKALAATKSYEFPSDMNESQNAIAENLSRLPSAAFDKEYVKVAVADHSAAEGLFSAEAKSGADPEVKAWAAKTLPVIKMHLQKAEALSSKVK
jgi:putative membrane protein